MSHLRDPMRRTRHLPLREQAINLNRVLRGDYAYDGIAGSVCALQKVHAFVMQYWRKMLSGVPDAIQRTRLWRPDSTTGLSFNRDASD